MELDRLARRGRVEGAERAERMLFDRIRDFAATDDDDDDDDGKGGAEGGGGVDVAAADVISFNSVLNAWARCGCADRAAALLSRMEYLSSPLSASIEDGGSSVEPLLPFRPSHVSYATVIDSWARRGGREGAREAETLLRRVEYAYSRSLERGGSHSGGGEQVEAEAKANVEAEDVAGIVVRPNVRMYASVINALAKSRWSGAGRKADALMARMERTRDLTLNATALGASADAAPTGEDLLPNAVLLTAAVDCHAQSRSRISALRAEQILRSTKDAYQAGNRDMKPTPVTYAAAINAWANSGAGIEAAERAESLLDEMEGHTEDPVLSRPNVVATTNVCKAWARSGHPECGNRAEATYRRMAERSSGLAKYDGWASLERSSRPNAVLLMAVIDAHAKSADQLAAPRHAERLLAEMDEAFADGNRDMKPDAVVLSTVVNAWARSPEAGAADRAEGALRDMHGRWSQMGDEYLRPSVGDIRTVVKAHLNVTDSNLDNETGDRVVHSAAGVEGATKAAAVLKWIHRLSTPMPEKGRCRPSNAIRPDKGIALDILAVLASLREANRRGKDSPPGVGGVGAGAGDSDADDTASLKRAATDLSAICEERGWLGDALVAASLDRAGITFVSPPAPHFGRNGHSG